MTGNEHVQRITRKSPGLTYKQAHDLGRLAARAAAADIAAARKAKDERKALGRDIPAGKYNARQQDQGPGRQDEPDRVPVYRALDLVDRIIDFESGNLGVRESAQLLADITNAGLGSQLQGSYGRAIKRAIETGLLITGPSGLWIIRELTVQALENEEV